MDVRTGEQSAPRLARITLREGGRLSRGGPLFFGKYGARACAEIAEHPRPFPTSDQLGEEKSGRPPVMVTFPLGQFLLSSSKVSMSPHAAAKLIRENCDQACVTN